MIKTLVNQGISRIMPPLLFSYNIHRKIVYIQNIIRFCIVIEKKCQRDEIGIHGGFKIQPV